MALIDKETIRAEIERLVDNYTPIVGGIDELTGAHNALAKLHAFLDTLQEQPVSDHHEIEVVFRGEKVTISREFYRDGERNYSTSEQDDNAIWSALRAWCEKKGITPFELYPKQPEQPVLPGIDEEGIHELRESEDEKIRKELIAFFQDDLRGDYWHDLEVGHILAYLEKQKEQKPNDDPLNDPKFIKGFETGREVQRIFDEKKPAEWSEEDEDMLNSCISSIEEAKENRYAYKETDGDTSYDHEIDWLKSLRPSWKPSEEQMKALKYAAYHMLPGEEYRDMLFSLFKDLKKLM